MGKEAWRPVKDLAENALAVSAIFAVIALPTVIVSGLVRLGAAIGMPSFTTSVLTILERIALVLDALVVLVYLGWRAWKFVKELVNE